VEVTSPTLEVPADVDRLEIEVVGDSSGEMLDVSFAVDSPWPHSYSVRPGSDDSEEVTIAVRGLKDGALVAERAVTDGFEPGESRTVRVVLGEGGTGDGGTDGGMPDGGPTDGGVDAGCVDDAECDDGVHCTDDTCEDGTCVNTPDSLLCAPGETCDPVEGCPPRVCMEDEHCDDGRVCNGAETCADEMCSSGAPMDCDDGDDCTDDACVEEREPCLHTTRDVDEDGVGDEACAETGGVPATDCNDMNPDISPGAPETCNGADDDCNGTCDDPFTCCRGEIGSCTTSCGTTGTRTCGPSCSWGVCSPPPEECNAVDDDCNGAVDDVFECEMGASCRVTCEADCTVTCRDTSTCELRCMGESEYTPVEGEGRCEAGA